jgi:1,4-alpha-glucan branching enzyme
MVETQGLREPSHLSLDEELSSWLERLKGLDSVLAPAVSTLIDVADAHRASGGIPSWISETAEASDRSLLVYALCCSTLQKVWQTRRRYSWLSKGHVERLKTLQQEIAERATALERSDADVRKLLADPVFGPLSPLTAAEVLWVLLNAAENRAFGATGFAALASMFWSLIASSAGDPQNISDPRASPAAITARWLLPIHSLQDAIRGRARLYRDIRDVARKLEELAAKAADPHFRWQFASLADRLAGLLLELSELAVNRTAMKMAVERIATKTRALQANDPTVPWPEIRRELIELVADLGVANQPRLTSAWTLLSRMKRDLLPAAYEEDDPAGLRTDLRPRRAGETKEQYRERMRESAAQAIERCRKGLRYLWRGVRACHAVCHEVVNGEQILGRLHRKPGRACRFASNLAQLERGDPLYWVLGQLAVANEDMADLIESVARPAVERCRAIVRQEVAYASAGNDTAFDATELLSAVLIAERWESISELEVDDALSKALRAQRPDGSWNTGKPIFREKRVLGLWPNTSDAVALLAKTALARPRIRRADAALMKFVDWLDRDRTDFDRYLDPSDRDADDRRKLHMAGWSTESRDAKTIDLWTTAVSIGALLEIREIVEQRLWQLCEKRFSVLRDLKRLDDVDPVDFGAAHEHRLHYRLRAAARQTRGTDYESAPYSFVLHGPPGSSKTALAEALGSEMWRERDQQARVVRVTPADFTRQGESGVDAEARLIFALLSHVRRVTIIFDEIDDLLRRREMKGAPAFLKMIVPAMLNRLQDLRDAAVRQEICSIIAMNYVDNVEPALVRPGRVDAVIPIVYPDPWSRENTMHRVFASKKIMPFDESLRARIIGNTAGWPWTTFSRLCREIVGREAEWNGIGETIDRLRGDIPSAAYVDPERWTPISPPLVNEVAHFAFAFARSERECSIEIERLLTQRSSGDTPESALLKAASEVVAKVGREWKTEKRAAYSRAAASRTPAMGMTMFPDEDVAIFRVWAPAIENVEVEIKGADSQVRRVPLADEGEGVWAGEVPEVRPGDSYRYALSLSSIPQPVRRTDPYGRELDENARMTIIAEPSLPSFPPMLQGWHDLLIYQIHPGTFTAEKTYAGVASRLTDLASLGVNAIELLSAAETAASENRSVEELFTAIVRDERQYGGLMDLHDLVDEAHRQRIAVIVGVTTHNLLGRAVANLHHFTGSNVYFHPDKELQATELGPRPDLHERQVIDLMTENATRWIREIGVDGLRWAGTNSIRTLHPAPTQIDEWKDGWNVLQRINRAIAGLGRGTLTIAQDVEEHRRLITTDRGCAGFGAQWSPGFERAVWGVLTSRSSPDLNALKQAFDRRGGDSFKRVIFAESNETYRKRRRFLKQALENAGFSSEDVLRRTFLGAMLALVAPGIPLLVQGQELCEGSLSAPVEWPGSELQRGIRRRFEDLIACRRNYHDSTPGLMGHFASCLQGKRGDDMFIVNRWVTDDRDSVVIVFNFGSEAQRDYQVQFPRVGRWLVRFNPAAPIYGDAFGAFHDSPEVQVAGNGLGRVSVGPNSAIVLSHERVGEPIPEGSR